MSPSPKTILKLAKDRIADPANWGKGSRRGGRGRSMSTCCAAEAIEESWPGCKERRDAFRALYNAAGLDHSDELSIVDWNDAPERTHDEVIKTFNLAIAIAQD